MNVMARQRSQSFPYRYNSYPRTRHPHEATIRSLASGMDVSALKEVLSCELPSRSDPGSLESLSYSWVHTRAQLQNMALALAEVSVRSCNATAIHEICASKHHLSQAAQLRIEALADTLQAEFALNTHVMHCFPYGVRQSPHQADLQMLSRPRSQHARDDSCRPHVPRISCTFHNIQDHYVGSQAARRDAHQWQGTAKHTTGLLGQHHSPLSHSLRHTWQ